LIVEMARFRNCEMPTHRPKPGGRVFRTFEPEKNGNQSEKNSESSHPHSRSGANKCIHRDVDRAVMDHAL
jgi:hypothetical protein